MKKKYLFFISLLILFGIGLILYNHYKVDNVYKEENLNNSNNINKGISMNLEQTAGAGDYKMVTQSEWPTDGYIFNRELSKCENGSTLSWDDTKKTVIMQGNLSDKCYVYFDKYMPPSNLADACDSGNNLATCVTSFANKAGPSISNIYYHDSNLENGAGDNSYRYAGANPNNYVCFGSDATTCSNDNLYRIIGVFDGKVKLIKYDYATSALLGTTGDYKSVATPDTRYYKGSLTSIDEYYWNSATQTSTWSEGLLNKTNLNTNFINNIGVTWGSKIITTIWKVGKHNSLQFSKPSIVYNYEVGTSSSSITYEAKIGLMYVSDYYYGASPSAWTLVGLDGGDETQDYRAAVSLNWLHMGNDEWTISSSTGWDTVVYRVISSGEVDLGEVFDDGAGNNHGGVRPVFFLNSSVAYVNGDGSISNPIRIS